MSVRSALLNRSAGRVALVLLSCVAAVAYAQQLAAGAAQDPKKLRPAAQSGPPGVATARAAPPPVTRDQVRRAVPKPDGISEMGEQNQLRMQQHMDRMAKHNEAVSNTMKKHSDTSSGIVSNLK